MLTARESKLGVLMKAAVVSVPLRAWLLKKPDWLDHQTADGLAFAVKTFAASLLALYIAFWAALDPAGAYPLVVARFTEILLGIICAALVSRLILVRELSPKLIELVRALARRADSFATVLLDPDADRERITAERTELAKAYL